MLTIEQLRSQFKPTSSDNNSGNSKYYPFWNMQRDEKAVVRFVPDKDESNPMGFLVEKLMHTLLINGEEKKVPCLKMYGEDCPICKVSAGYYNDGDKINGKKYYRKKQHIAQAIIIEDPLPLDAETGENSQGKLKFLSLGFQLYNVIEAAFGSGDLDQIPYAFEGGYNFNIMKTHSGDYDVYSIGSGFARKATDLTPEQLKIVEEESVELKTLLPKHPGRERVELMLDAALNGTVYTEPTNNNATTQNQQQVPSDSTTSSATSDPVDNSSIDDEADKIIAQIKARQAQRAG